MTKNLIKLEAMMLLLMVFLMFFIWQLSPLRLENIGKHEHTIYKKICENGCELIPVNKMIWKTEIACDASIIYSGNSLEARYCKYGPKGKLPIYLDEVEVGNEWVNKNCEMIKIEGLGRYLKCGEYYIK